MSYELTNHTNDDTSEISCAQGCQEPDREGDGSDRGEEVAEVVLYNVGRVLENFGVSWLSQPLLSDIFNCAAHLLFSINCQLS